MSCGVPMRPSGTCCSTTARVSGLPSMKAVILLSNGPGAIALTVIDSLASRLPTWRVSWCTAALLAL